MNKQQKEALDVWMRVHEVEAAEVVEYLTSKGTENFKGTKRVFEATVLEPRDLT